MAKTKSIKIPKGKIIFVSAKSDTMSDKRFFTDGGKLTKWLRFLNKHNHKGLRIRFKELRKN